ncbi:hypothetical protein [Dryocola sp. BD613]|uniref:hypothetical protein n=1 Tax=Dryocola sp. BD613 TaxID=3133272 RepID=UPI003F50C494
MPTNNPDHLSAAAVNILLAISLSARNGDGGGSRNTPQNNSVSGNNAGAEMVWDGGTSGDRSAWLPPLRA